MSLEQTLLQHEPAIRLVSFFGIFALVAFGEWRAPRRALRVSRWLRWGNNLGLVALNTLVLRLVFPATAVGMAALAAERGWGLLNVAAVPPSLSVLIALVALDLVIWTQHVMVHAIPVLWRLHRVHHADLDYDLTTGSRFHPLEILLSLLIKLAAILVLGPPVVAVILFEVILSGMALFNHGNIRLPAGLDRVLRLILVTPDMHRVHHSIEEDEANSNFGFNLSIWDRMFGTYRAQSRAGQTEMAIGIRGWNDPKWVTWLPGLLLLPFRDEAGSYPLSTRRWVPRER